MRSITTTLGLVIALTAFCNVSADDKKKADQDAQQKAYEALAKPGKPHAHFRRLVGRWNCELKMVGAEGTTKGTAVFRVLLGGRYLQQQFRATMMGKPFQGLGTTGFDNATKKYVGSWIDNHSTGIMTMEGSYNAKTQTLTEIGTTSSPDGPGKMKMVTHYLSDDKFTFTMNMVLPGDKVQKLMEITYTRAAKKKPRKKRSKKKD